jgi:hypothetical protein
MGQFDSETSAALAQLNYQELSTTPGGEFVGLISDLIALIGVAGPLAVAGGASNLLLKVRKLAGAGYSENLVYVITAVRNDLDDLYKRHEELRGRIESLPTDQRFAEAISALALRAMQTSVKERLKRLARIVVNGVKEDDFEPETLDDMMRAAVELSHRDVTVLDRLVDAQGDLNVAYQPGPNGTITNIARLVWERLRGEGLISTSNALEIRVALEKLQSHGFCVEIPVYTPSNWLPDVLATPLGIKFAQRIRQAEKMGVGDETNIQSAASRGGCPRSRF